jgi:DUF4097 and DUF4098 domain-containing protein YvlB
MKTVTRYSVILALILSFSINSIFASSAASKDEKKVIKEKTFQIAEGKKINVTCDGGDVVFTPWDKSEVYVKITANEKAAEKYDLIFESNSDEITVKAERKNQWNWFSNLSLKIEVKVPARFNIYVGTSGGDIKVGGVHGGIYLETSGGDIWGDRFEGNFYASTSGGDINLFCSNAKIEASTSGGDIKVEYSGENQGIDLSTSGGDIDVKVPADFNARVDLSTSGGDVDCNLTLNDVKELSETEIRGDINKGGKPLNASTSGGDVSVYKK